ncbi:glycosyltransferase family 39 protein [Rapidithrix thailandica]|uniref:Glycosyltransferase family 39 protein n=1 Tax=Rapidithrix thailandica TaxID=413964 RepID=A0AAW9RWJ5_9BACT
MPSNKIIFSILFIFTTTLLITFYHRAIHLDDVWLGEHAYWLAKEGVVRSELFRGLLDYESQLFVYHKFFVLNGAWLISLFGWSPYVLKSIGLLYSLIFFIFVFRYYKNSSQTQCLLFSALLVSNPVFIEYVFVYRPEVMLMSLGFLSFFFLKKYLESSKWIHLLLSAGLAGLCFYTHLNGLVYIGAGGLTLLLYRKIGPALLFGGIATPVAALYFLDVYQANAWEPYLSQFNNDPAVEKRGSWGLVLNLLEEHKRFFHSPREIGISLLVIPVLALRWKSIFYHKRLELMYVIIISFSLAVLHDIKTSKYMLLYLPQLLILVAFALENIYLQVAANWKKGVTVLLGLYFLNGLVSASILFLKNKNQPAYNQQITQYMGEKGGNVMAVMPFVFNEIENFRIMGQHYYVALYEKYTGEPLTTEAFFKDMEQKEIQAILIDEDLLNKLPLPLEYGNYRCIFQEEEIRVYQKK